MKYCNRLFKRTILTVIGLILAAQAPFAASAVFLTPQERAYIAEKKIVKAVSLDGVAPIQYTDANGEVRGISRQVLDEISQMTGLCFEYRLYDVLAEAYLSGGDILFGLPPHYAAKGMVLSRSYLKSETILFVNSSLKSSHLEDKRYAAVKGSALPEGIKEEFAIYFDTREESLNAVESGEADYGYGNAYSIAFYSLQHNYKNILAIPKSKESRSYCIGFFDDDPLLMSIIDKSLAAIDENHMQTIILNATTDVERDITFSVLMSTYGKEILIGVSTIMGVLLFSVFINLRTNSRLRIQNRKHEILSQISNEYLYEYLAKDNRLVLSEKCAELFGVGNSFDEAVLILKATLSSGALDECVSPIKLPLSNGKTGSFKAVNYNIHDQAGNLDTIIGKLIDISEEAEEKERLILKAQTDGLTGLYNATTSKELIDMAISSKEPYQTDAFVLMDCDNFKEINDTFGHLIGDQVLEHIGESLKSTFRSTDIIGRMGGDEFCVYMKNISSDDFIIQKCLQLSSVIEKSTDNIHISISIGVSLISQCDTYEAMFKMADEALYEAKRSGKSKLVIYEAMKK